MIRAAVAALLLAASPAVAQSLVYSDTATADCLQRATDGWQRRACIGASANACMSATPDGSTTVGMGGCIDRELASWDAVLNQAYQTLRRKAKAADADNATMTIKVPSVDEALRDMQRSWIAWRDATCDFERSQWGGGTGGGPATLSCLMRLTGEQALYLGEAWIGD